MTNNNNVPTYLKKNTLSTLLVLSAASALLLLASTLLPLSNTLLQPVQAQTSVSFRTTTESAADDSGGDSDNDINVSFRTTKLVNGTLCTNDEAKLTFEATGTQTSNNTLVKITGGTFQVTSSNNGQILYGGNIQRGDFDNTSRILGLSGPVDHVPNSRHTCATTGQTFAIGTQCSTSNTNRIAILNEDANNYIGRFNGPVECSSSQGGNATQQSSSSPMTGSTATTQDGDGDGIPDSSDRCTHNSNQRCYKESK